MRQAIIQKQNIVGTEHNRFWLVSCDSKRSIKGGRALQQTNYPMGRANAFFMQNMK